MDWAAVGSSCLIEWLNTAKKLEVGGMVEEQSGHWVEYKDAGALGVWWACQFNRRPHERLLSTARERHLFDQKLASRRYSYRIEQRQHDMGIFSKVPGTSLSPPIPVPEHDEKDPVYEVDWSKEEERKAKRKYVEALHTG